MKRGGEYVGVAEGYVEQGDDTIKSVLDRMYKSLHSGWYDKELKEQNPEGIRYEKTAGRSFSVPVERNMRVWSADKGDFKILEGKVPGNKIEEWVPLIQPSAIVDYSKYQRHSNLHSVKTHLSAMSDAEIDEYRSLINIDYSKQPIEINLNLEKNDEIKEKLELIDWFEDFDIPDNQKC